MIIKTNKNDRCPICDFFITPPNCWVKYHVRYNKEISILACKYCNYTEYCLRTNQKGGKQVLKRFKKVLQYQAKFNVII